MAKRKLRVGMIGAGGISHLHCEGWTKLPDCELVAITDVNRDAALKRAEEFHIETVEASAKRLVARKDLDVIDIVTPNRLHKEQTLMSLRAGKHVLCEKPLGLNPQEVDQMIAAAEKAKRKLMCAQHMRFEDRSVALKRYVAAGTWARSTTPARGTTVGAGCPPGAASSTTTSRAADAASTSECTSSTWRCS
ncbi:MAG TPA: Gfo/Idh/MocA family oxidoreductase [Phycisphaerae bacterium]|nr:Gfo/Idh/MocA family oxidoreductase [Phycisphaerae bacterium]